jgi:hypothetical protein
VVATSTWTAGRITLREESGVVGVDAMSAAKMPVKKYTIKPRLRKANRLKACLFQRLSGPKA